VEKNRVVVLGIPEFLGQQLGAHYVITQLRRSVAYDTQIMMIDIIEYRAICHTSSSILPHQRSVSAAPDGLVN
jgi:hypothetical protein